MFGIGMFEMIIIGGIALVVIGPEKFPEFAKIFMRTIRDVRSYVDEAKTEITKELAPIKKELDELSRIKPEEYIDSLMGDDSDDDKDLKSEHEMYGEELYEYEDDMEEDSEPSGSEEPPGGEEPVNLNREDEGLLNYEVTSETASGSDESPHIEPHPDDYPDVEPPLGEETEPAPEDAEEAAD